MEERKKKAANGLTPVFSIEYLAKRPIDTASRDQVFSSGLHFAGRERGSGRTRLHGVEPPRAPAPEKRRSKLGEGIGARSASRRQLASRLLGNVCVARARSLGERKARVRDADNREEQEHGPE